MTSETPVLIVGGGAVGCVLSMELARRGIEYRCIDRMPGPGRESRAIALHARTIELMDLVDKEKALYIVCYLTPEFCEDDYEEREKHLRDPETGEDRVEFEHRDGSSTVTLTKRTE